MFYSERMPIDRKTEIAPTNGTPVKRMFWSIISDYDLQTGMCELVDNALDFWTETGRKKPLTIRVNADFERQSIEVLDNAGGVKRDELRLLIVPGGSRNEPLDEVIGIFGVGGKRAAIALAETVQIKTRYKSQTTHELDITSDWLESEGWDLPTYEIPNIDPGTTRIEMNKLRKPFTREDMVDLAAHFGDTYSWFLEQGCETRVDGESVKPHRFDHWAYPVGFPPRKSDRSLDFGRDGVLHISMTGGLIIDRDPIIENYGVYIYCNHRLIVKALKTREVGYFVTGEAGVPHPDASLCRVIVEMQGAAKAMPWNSSKSGINDKHPAFLSVRPTLIQMVSYYSSLSRRLKNSWEEDVFSHRAGHIDSLEEEDIAQTGRLNLPSLPKVNKPEIEKLKAKNKKVLTNQPWTTGLLESIAAVSVLERQRFETRNRMALILLDSNFEIALKEFIVHRKDLFPPKEFNDGKIREIFGRRHEVIKVVRSKVNISQVIWDKAAHYYELRNKLIHERATLDISTSDVTSYRSTVEQVLRALFGMRF